MTRSICVVGAGIVGTNLARAFTSVGHHVVLGARDLSSDKVIATRDELELDVIAEANPSATLVKGFNTIGAEAFVNPTIDSTALFLPIAGDIGFDAIVTGDRGTARIVENAAELWIHLAFRTGLGRNFGFARLER